MSKTNLAMAALVGASIVSSGVAHAQSQPQRDTNPLARYLDIATPEFRGREFVLGQIAMRTELSLGCDGTLSAALFDNLAGDINSAIDYALANAHNFAINAIAFSNPTLYQIVEDVNRSFQALRSLNVGTCSTVRTMASDYRKRQEQRAIEECMSDGGNADECASGDGLQAFIPEALRKAAERLEAVTGSETFTMRKLWEKVAEGIGGGLPVEGTSTSPRVDAPSEQLREDAYDLLGDGNIGETNTSGDGVDWDPRTSNVGEKISNREADYRLWLDDITKTTAGGAAKLSDSQFYDDIMTDPSFGMLSDSTLASLTELREERPWIYESTRDAMAREMGEAYIRYVISWMRAILHAAESGAFKLQSDRDAEELMLLARKNLELAEAELGVITARRENTARIGEIERLINRIE